MTTGPALLLVFAATSGDGTGTARSRSRSRPRTSQRTRGGARGRSSSVVLQVDAREQVVLGQSDGNMGVRQLILLHRPHPRLQVTRDGEEEPVGTVSYTHL